MEVIVVDNPALLPLFLHDEDDTCAQGVISPSIAGESLIASSLCLLEFGNGILKAVRQNRLTGAEAAFAHRKLVQLPIEFLEPVKSASGLPLIHALAQRHGPSFDDATYLFLTLDAGARLASLDTALVGAVRTEGVEAV